MHVLTLKLELRAGAPWPAGAVLLTNMDGEDIRIWQTGNQWGDAALSFEILRGASVRRIFPSPRDYTRNAPSSVVVPPGHGHVLNFDLDDGNWDAGAPIETLTAPPAQLVAVYDIPPSPEAIDQGVWTGHLRSDPAPLGA
jgi:hypothetical protein